MGDRAAVAAGSSKKPALRSRLFALLANARQVGGVCRLISQGQELQDGESQDEGRRISTRSAKRWCNKSSTRSEAVVAMVFNEWGHQRNEAKGRHVRMAQQWEHCPPKQG